MKKLINEFDPEYPDQPVRCVEASNTIEESTKKIEESAKKYALREGFHDELYIEENAFIAGAKSLEAKAYWLYQFKQNNDLYIALKLKELYSENEVLSLLIQSTNIYLDFISAALEGEKVEKPDLFKWFEEIKK